MIKSIIINLIQNIAVLLSFALVYTYLWEKTEEIRHYWEKILAGIIIGLIGIFLMNTTLVLFEGINFDMRTVLISVSGLFFGAIPTIVAILITVSYRIILGGAGMLMGVSTLVGSGIIGLLWRHFSPPKKIKKPFWNFLFFGLAVHLLMLIFATFLPISLKFETFKIMLLPTLFIFVPGTLLLAMLLFRRLTLIQMQKKLEKDEEEYRTLINNASEGIVVVQDGYHCFANPRLEKIMLYSREELLSQPFLDYIHPDDREMIRERYKTQLESEKLIKWDFHRIIDKAGNTKWMESNSVKINWEEKPAILIFTRDMTEQRETQQQLQIMKEKAEESDRLKSIFIANMSHEIRTPMNGIMGFSDLMLNGELSKEKRDEYLNMIRSSSKRLLAIINDIMELSKLDSAAIQISSSIFRITSFLEEILNEFRKGEILKDKSEVELRINIPDSLKQREISSDAYVLEQILNRLIDNAIKYTKNGFVEVGCSLIKEKGNEELLLYVKDSGPGISPDKHSMVFERFRQVEEDVYHEGAGLGLSIVKGFVELMGGKTYLESQEGKGACFSFTVPVKVQKVKIQESSEEDNKKPDLSKLRILVAEDDPGSCYLLKEYLESCGALPRWSRDGNVLMQMLEQEVPDLLLLDINLPGKSGYACLDEIREKGYKMKIIVQTAYAMPEEQKAFFEVGSHGYLAKPYLPEDLYREIYRVLKNQ